MYETEIRIIWTASTSWAATAQGCNTCKYTPFNLLESLNSDKCFFSPITCRYIQELDDLLIKKKLTVKRLLMPSKLLFTLLSSITVWSTAKQDPSKSNVIWLPAVFEVPPKVQFLLQKLRKVTWQIVPPKLSVRWFICFGTILEKQLKAFSSTWFRQEIWFCVWY